MSSSNLSRKSWSYAQLSHLAIFRVSSPSLLFSSVPRLTCCTDPTLHLFKRASVSYLIHFGSMKRFEFANSADGEDDGVEIEDVDLVIFQSPSTAVVDTDDEVDGRSLSPSISFSSSSVVNLDSTSNRKKYVSVTIAAILLIISGVIVVTVVNNKSAVSTATTSTTSSATDLYEECLREERERQSMTQTPSFASSFAPSLSASPSAALSLAPSVSRKVSRLLL